MILENLKFDRIPAVADMTKEGGYDTHIVGFVVSGCTKNLIL